eukprot:TRINITY_DN6273_c3_g1_i1.p1 TRINITY_DN6273_c3_g1~~TRINITY_DN6273_c3_g1_i1.p1  ORF type:complete len:175 (+),score=51.13 TRINITY_DN6273_c3_g1_i1:43-525(+)
MRYSDVISRNAGALLDNCTEVGDKMKGASDAKGIYDLPTDIVVGKGITASRYLQRLLDHTQYGSNVLAGQMILLQRFVKKTNIQLNSSNIYRVLLVTLVIAGKQVCDDYLTNTSMAEIGGMSLSVLNQLEVAFLNSLEWEVVITKKQFLDMQEYLAVATF